MINKLKVSFIIPVYNAEKDILFCLKSIKSQNYPMDLIEILVFDGGSTDATIEISEGYGCIVFENKLRFQEYAKIEGFKKSNGDIVCFLDADNELSDDNWLNNLIKCFENINVECAFAKPIVADDMNIVNKYVAYFADPLSYFVFNKANVTVSVEDDFNHLYNLVYTDNFINIYEYEVHNFPVLALTAGTAIRRTFNWREDKQGDDILPIIQIIEDRKLIALSKCSYTFHYCSRNFFHYYKKMKWRIRNNINKVHKHAGLSNRKKYLNNKRKLKMYLFVPYSITLILPIVTSLLRFRKTKSFSCFLHIPLCFLLSLCICKEIIFKVLNLEKDLKAYGK